MLTSAATATACRYLVKKIAQFEQVFPKLSLLGWYTNGAEVTAEHMKVHMEVLPFNETPLFLLLDSNPSAAARELPLKMHESLVTPDGKMTFVNTTYTLASLEAERIGVDHVAKVKATSTATSASEVTEHLGSQHSAVDMLYQRIKVIRSYLFAVKAGELPRDHELLRQVSGLCSRLPIAADEDGGKSFVMQSNDVLLVSHLATITKGCNAMNEMLGKLAIVHDKGGMRRHRSWF